MVPLGAGEGGGADSPKKTKSKISCHSPFSVKVGVNLPLHVIKK